MLSACETGRGQVAGGVAQGFGQAVLEHTVYDPSSGQLLSGSYDKIRSDTLELHALQGASPPDQPKIDELGNQLDWETRIFEDRRRVVKFVCDVPTTIDQRLFALGRTIQQEIE